MIPRVDRDATLTTEDGRTLAYYERGKPDGVPVLISHGTPGSRFTRHPDPEMYARHGVHAVIYDRPGYGRSDPHFGRTVADAAADFEAIADELGFERFGLTGGSGGGPHVLACAALHADRVIRATCNVGVTPYGDDGLGHDAWLDGMDPENVKEFTFALESEAAVTEYVTAQQAEAERRVAKDPSTVFDDYDLSDSDRAQLARPEVMQIFREATFEWAANGVGGWVDDDLAFTRPWGFDVAAIEVPVLVVYGTSDVLVPPAHGEWLAANVPGCLVKVEAGGHLGTDPVTEITENLGWLKDGVVPANAR